MIRLAHQTTVEEIQRWHWEVQKQHERFYPSKILRAIQIGLWVLVGVAIGYMVQLAPQYLTINLSLDLFMFWFVIVLLSIAANWLWRWRLGPDKWFQAIAGYREWVISPEGISFFANDERTFYAWGDIIALQETEDCCYLYLDNFRAIPIPRSAEVLEGQAEFWVLMRQFWQQYPDNQGQVLPEIPYKGFLLKRYLNSFAHNLLAGLKLAFARKVQLSDFRVSRGQFIGLVLYQILIFAAHDYADNTTFNVYGLTGYSALLLMVLLAAYIVAASAAAPRSLLRLLVLTMAATVVIETIYIGLDRVLSNFSFYGLDQLWMLWMVQVLWIIAAIWLVLRLLYRFPYPRTLHLLGIYVFFAIFVGAYFSDQRFFVQDYSADSQVESPPALNVEDTFYKQPQLLADVLDKIQPERAGVVDMYFVGFAGQAEEKVFANEVRYAHALMDKQFDTAGRSVSLLNSTDSVKTVPLANAHNLSMLLQGIASRMNVEEDVLFLFLTSHGSAEFDLNLSFWPLQLNNLAASQLKEILDASGIKNRVIVISACYSGGFIDVLQNDHSLILTAARKDRASFGCGVDSEYTYFSHAFFVQELANSRSFMEAFEKARVTIAAREKAEQPDNDPSLPQAFEGPEIKARLAQYFSRLALSQ